jgi:hypothetical protein
MQLYGPFRNPHCHLIVEYFSLRFIAFINVTIGKGTYTVGSSTVKTDNDMVTVFVKQ